MSLAFPLAAASLGGWLDQALEPEGLSPLLRIALLMTALAVLPSLLVMFTSFVRLIVVFHFLRQALGTQSFPPGHVMTGLALILTFFVMAPVAERVYTDAVQPYEQGALQGDQALQVAVGHVKQWMLRNTREADLLLFARLARLETSVTRETIPLRVVAPAFLISELKTGFQIGFLLFLPFLVIDLVVSSVLLSMGMMMLPPVTISFPFKILLFVLVDGWHLIVGSLVRSFQ